MRIQHSASWLQPGVLGVGMGDPGSLGLSSPGFPVCSWRILGVYGAHQLHLPLPHFPCLASSCRSSTSSPPHRLGLRFLVCPPWPQSSSVLLLPFLLLPDGLSYPITSPPTPASPPPPSPHGPHPHPFIDSRSPWLRTDPNQAPWQWKLTGDQGPAPPPRCRTPWQYSGPLKEDPVWSRTPAWNPRMP